MSIYKELPSLYPCKVRIVKFHTRGNLEGLETDCCKMGFTSWSEAIDWARRVNDNTSNKYVVTKLHNLETNEVELL